MTIGDKLKKLRQLRGMTQNDLAGSAVSRNMICQIERGNGNPSLAVLKYLSKKLCVDPGYFLTEKDDLQEHLVSAQMPLIKEAFALGHLRDCIHLCEPFTGDQNDELMHILAICYCRCGAENYEIGYLDSAKSDFSMAKQYAERSMYSASLKTEIEFWVSILEDATYATRLHRHSVPEQIQSIYETVLYRHMLSLISDNDTETALQIQKSLAPKCTHYNRHIEARILMAKKENDRAAVLLWEIIREKEKRNITVPFLMQVYRDLELCLKAIGDFEGAYRCSKQLLSYSENTHL